MALDDLMPERSPFQLTRSCRQFLAALAGKRALGNWSQHSRDVLHHRPDCFGGFLVGQPNFWISKDESKFGRPPFSKTTHRRCVLLGSQAFQDISAAIVQSSAILTKRLSSRHENRASKNV